MTERSAPTKLCERLVTFVPYCKGKVHFFILDDDVFVDGGECRDWSPPVKPGDVVSAKHTERHVHGQNKWRSTGVERIRTALSELSLSSRGDEKRQLSEAKAATSTPMIVAPSAGATESGSVEAARQLGEHIMAAGGRVLLSRLGWPYQKLREQHATLPAKLITFLGSNDCFVIAGTEKSGNETVALRPLKDTRADREKRSFGDSAVPVPQAEVGGKPGHRVGGESVTLATETPLKGGAASPTRTAIVGSSKSGASSRGGTRLKSRLAVADTTATTLTYADRVEAKAGRASEEAKWESQSPTVGNHGPSDPGAVHVPWAKSIPLDQEVMSSKFRSLFDPPGSGSPVVRRGVALGDEHSSALFPEAGLLGLVDNDHLGLSHNFTARAAEYVFLNTNEPFCAVTVGVQGGGKSHTLACVLESCLLPDEPIVRLTNPHAALVLHYDTSTNSICEVTGLISPLPEHGVCLPKEKMTVLVSPTFYRQRKAFYGDYCTVRPLLFKWASLTADHLKRIMRIQPGDTQLYVAVLLDLLRRYQRGAQIPVFQDFVAEVRSECKLPGQDGPLGQRLQLLDSIIAESESNADLAEVAADLSDVCASGNLVVVDLSDPLLSRDEANGIFAVLTEQFRTMPLRGGGLGGIIVIDEAHKFMDGENNNDGLSQAIVDVARLMRHDGMRLMVSTQSPKALAPELLELLTVAVLHRFHSRDWLTYLKNKIPLEAEASWQALVDLQPGHALVFATSHAGSDTTGRVVRRNRVFPICVRKRLTADRGSTVTNV